MKRLIFTLALALASTLHGQVPVQATTQMRTNGPVQVGPITTKDGVVDINGRSLLGQYWVTEIVEDLTLLRDRKIEFRVLPQTNAASYSNDVALRAHVDPVNGDDATATVGGRAFRTIQNAVIAANVYGNVGKPVDITLAASTNYNVGTNAIVLGKNVSLRGPGSKGCWILGNGRDSDNSPIIQPNDNTSLEGITVLDSAPDDFGGATVGWKSGSPNTSTNASATNCWFVGGADNIYVSTEGVARMSFLSCGISGKWDQVTIIGDQAFDHRLTFVNCHIASDHWNAYAAEGAPTHGIFADNGLVDIHGGSVTVISTNDAQHSAVRARGSNAVINLHGGTQFRIDAPHGKFLRNDAGGVITSRDRYDSNLVSGPITWTQ